MLYKTIRNPLGCLASTAWRYSIGWRSQAVLYLVLSASSMTASMAEPFVIGKIIDLLQTSGDHSQACTQIFIYLGVYAGLTLAFWVLHGPARLIERRVAFAVRSSYQMALLNTLLSLPVAWHRSNHSGATIERASKATTSLYEFCDGSFNLLHTAVRLFGSLAVLCLFMPNAGLIMTLATALVLMITAAFDRTLLRQYEEINGRFRFVAEAVHDYITNVITVISLRLKKSVSTEVSNRLAAVLPPYRRNVATHEWKWFSLCIFVAVAVSFVLALYCYNEVSLGHQILAGTFFTLFEYLRRMTDSFYGIADKWGRLVSQAASVRAAEHILAAQGRDGQNTKPALPQDWQRLDLSGIAFTYGDQDGKPHTLKDVSLTLERGRSYAFVGESGSGKSTLLSLLRGLHEIETGQVICDTVALESGIRRIAESTTLIPQDPEIFADTIRFNVCMGLSSSDEQILSAIRSAQFESVLNRLPQGLDTNIAENGVNLSGGEKQRLALARGIFFSRGSSLILLDEPTSSVDAFNERIIYKNILRTFRDQCVVSSVHKFHLLSLFDYIYVFSHGQLVESGEFQDLLAKRGELYRLWSNHVLDEDENLARDITASVK